MDEGRKRVLGLMAAILLAPKAKDYFWDGREGNPANESWLMASISLAERIMRMIDAKFPRN